MTCPVSGLENIPSVHYCDCGHPLMDTAPAQSLPRTFTVEHILKAWGIGTAFVMTQGFLSNFLPLPALWWFPPQVILDRVKWMNGPILGLLFYGIVFGAVAFWLLDWLYWRP